MHVLTRKACQRIRQDALRHVFSSLRKAPEGTHETPTAEEVKKHDRLANKKVVLFGDPAEKY